MCHAPNTQFSTQRNQLQTDIRAEREELNSLADQWNERLAPAVSNSSGIPLNQLLLLDGRDSIPVQDRNVSAAQTLSVSQHSHLRQAGETLMNILAADQSLDLAERSLDVGGAGRLDTSSSNLENAERLTDTIPGQVRASIYSMNAVRGMQR